MTPLTEFYRTFVGDPPGSPALPDREKVQLCMRLIKEEYREVTKDFRQLELESHLAVDPDIRYRTMARLLKELCDLRYVVEYAAVALGLPIDEAYAEVHRANMSKVGDDGRAILDEGGKVQKGPNYRPPDMDRFVAPEPAQAYEVHEIPVEYEERL